MEIRPKLDLVLEQITEDYSSLTYNTILSLFSLKDGYSELLDWAEKYKNDGKMAESEIVDKTLEYVLGSPKELEKKFNDAQKNFLEEMKSVLLFSEKEAIFVTQLLPEVLYDNFYYWRDNIAIKRINNGDNYSIREMVERIGRAYFSEKPKLIPHLDLAKSVAKAYESGNFNDIFSLFSEDIEWFSQYSYNDRHGKEEVLEYYKEKQKSMNGKPNIKCTIYEDWQTGYPIIFCRQDLGNEIAESWIELKFDGNYIRRIGICIPNLFSYVPVE